MISPKELNVGILLWDLRQVPTLSGPQYPNSERSLFWALPSEPMVLYSYSSRAQLISDAEAVFN